MQRPIDTNAEFCGRVPLNQTNLIQPHGVLLIVDRASGLILQASENVPALLGQEATTIVQTSLDQYVPAEQLEALGQRFAEGISGKLPFRLRFGTVEGERTHLVLAKAEEKFYVLEVDLEPEGQEGEESFLNFYQQFKVVMARIESSRSTEETCRLALEELKRISGFDKLMVYRFDEDWNGTVIAELMEPGIESYLHLKFPASDIPKQARELYRTTPYRLIPDIHYKPVRLYPVLNPVTNAFTDLSDSNLRSVAGVHLEYLQNMKVTASMSTRIIVDGQLWGLISCHHRSPLHLMFDRCAAFELVSNLVSAKIAAMRHADLFAYKTAMTEQLGRLMSDVYRQENLSLGLQADETRLLQLLGATGAALVQEGQVETFGQAPALAEVEDLVIWLRSAAGKKVTQFNQLPDIFEAAESYLDVASGLLVLPIQPDRGTYVLAFRPEAVRQVSWGGNPNEALQFEADGKKYHPRNSFRIWQQTVKRTALPWRPEELEMAEQFRNFVIEYTLTRIYS